MKDFLTFEEIPMGSIWMAADGGSYGCYVIGKNYETKDITYLGFNKCGWFEDVNPWNIDYFKLQYRYCQVA
jgi:hypothetical protein